MERFGTAGTIDSPGSDDRYTPEIRRARRRAMQSALTWEKRLSAEVDKVTPPEAESRSDATVVWEQASSDKAWLVRWVLADQGSALVVRSLTIEAAGRATPASGVTANILRELSPAGICAATWEARENLIEKEADARARGLTVIGETDDGLLIPDESPSWAMLLRWGRSDARNHGPDVAEKRRPGRPPLTEEFLATVAIAYLDELPKGRGVLARVARRLEAEQHRKKDSIPVETVRDWVSIARRQKYLSPAPKQGQRGGEPGPKLRELLDNKEGE
jgi:hypothetical protein